MIQTKTHLMNMKIQKLYILEICLFYNYSVILCILFPLQVLKLFDIIFANNNNNKYVLYFCDTYLIMYYFR